MAFILQKKVFTSLAFFGSGAVDSESFDSPVTARSTIVVIATIEANNTAFSLIDSQSNSYTPIGPIIPGFGDGYCAGWYAYNVLGGACQISFSVAGSGYYGYLVAYELAPIPGYGNPFINVQSNNQINPTTSTVTTPSITSPVATAVLFAALTSISNDGDFTSIGTGVGWTEDFEYLGNSFNLAADIASIELASSGAYTHQWTLGESHGGASVMIVAVKSFGPFMESSGAPRLSQLVAASAGMESPVSTGTPTLPQLINTDGRIQTAIGTNTPRLDSKHTHFWGAHR